MIATFTLTNWLLVFISYLELGLLQNLWQVIIPYANTKPISQEKETGIINLPKIKGIKTVFSREFIGKIKTVTVSKTATGKYYASILADTGEHDTIPTPTTIDPNLTVGIDLGISQILTLSDGSKFDNPKYLAQASQRLAIGQKIFARKQKTSKNYQRQKLAVARIYERVRNSRLDLHHKITHKLICENQATSYAIEDLSVKNMVKKTENLPKRLMM